MPKKIAINGFGRIGRMVLRALIESGRTDLEVVAINDLANAERLAQLLKYDSIHGRFPANILAELNKIFIDDTPILCFSERDPAKLPWANLDIDIVMECTGFFLTQDLCGKHIWPVLSEYSCRPLPRMRRKLLYMGLMTTSLTPLTYLSPMPLVQQMPWRRCFLYSTSITALRAGL